MSNVVIPRSADHEQMANEQMANDSIAHDSIAHERTTPHDTYFNYCWWPYEPVAATAGKLRPVSLLYRSFEIAGVADVGRKWVKRIQQELGLFRTVYGVKWDGRQISWELYVYDYERRERQVSISRFLQAVSSFAETPVSVNENLPYFMFSIELTPSILRGDEPIDTVHMYLGNPGSAVSSGMSYEITVDHTRLENFYFFFSARDQLQDAAEKVFCSAHVDAAQIDVDSVLRPELRDCHTICVANKRLADTAYFSGVSLESLSFFMDWQQYPRPLRNYIAEHSDHLDHLLYDVGFDYRSGTGDQSGALSVTKSGFYGVF